ncbi:MAG: hypothetical protein JWM68_5149 [Verrucomicrobiales bacterium]|nr:hypothetical protein [Verrucomicrobiales bacterium]
MHFIDPVIQSILGGLICVGSVYALYNAYLIAISLKLPTTMLSWRVRIRWAGSFVMGLGTVSLCVHILYCDFASVESNQNEIILEYTWPHPARKLSLDGEISASVERLRGKRTRLVIHSREERYYSATIFERDRVIAYADKINAQVFERHR